VRLLRIVLLPRCIRPLPRRVANKRRRNLLLKTRISSLQLLLHSSKTVTRLEKDVSETAPDMKLYGYIRRTNYCGIGILMYGHTGYCLPLPHLCHQHVCTCPDVDVRTVTLHIRDSKLNANPCVTLINFDDAPKYRRTQHLSVILQAGRANGNSKIRSTTLFKICKHDSTRDLCDSTSKLIN
jgi:hypothetical protein